MGVAALVTKIVSVPIVFKFPQSWSTPLWLRNVTGGEELGFTSPLYCYLVTWLLTSLYCSWETVNTSLLLLLIQAIRGESWILRHQFCSTYFPPDLVWGPHRDISIAIELAGALGSATVAEKLHLWGPSMSLPHPAVLHILICPPSDILMCGSLWDPSVLSRGTLCWFIDVRVLVDLMRDAKKSSHSTMIGIVLLWTLKGYLNYII